MMYKIEKHMDLIFKWYVFVTSFYYFQPQHWVFQREGEENKWGYGFNESIH